MRSNYNKVHLTQTQSFPSIVLYYIMNHSGIIFKFVLQLHNIGLLIQLYGCTTWTLRKRLEKKLDGNYTRMLRAILNKSWRQQTTRHQLYGHRPPITKTNQIRRTRHAGHCWRSRDELISNVLLWTSTYGRAKAGQPARTYIQQLCEDTGCSPEDLSEALNDWGKWRERVRDIRASGTTRWWWYVYHLYLYVFLIIYIYIYILFIYIMSRMYIIYINIKFISFKRSTCLATLKSSDRTKQSVCGWQYVRSSMGVEHSSKGISSCSSHNAKLFERIEHSGIW